MGSIFWNKSSKNEANSDSNQPDSVPKELPELAIEKYPLDSAFKKEEVKPEPIIIQAPVAAPVIVPEIKLELSKKVVEPAPIPKIEVKIEPQKPTLDTSLQVEEKQKPQVPNEIEGRAGNTDFYFKNITKMNIPPPKGRYPEELLADMENDTENVRRELKNSFFSLIKEKIQKNEYHSIPDDSKLFLYEMRRHHESIAEKEKILKQKSALDSALAEKITLLELLEEGWYLLRKEIETKQILLIEKEKLIDEMTKDLKFLMNKSGNFDKSFEKMSVEKQKTFLPEDKWFVLKNGRKISSITELKETLKNVDDETFYHHVSSQKNDFSSWIRHVFSDASLADKILYAKSKHELVSILDNWKEN